jgi:potassium-dependent mechanosensitive channel
MINKPLYILIFFIAWSLQLKAQDPKPIEIRGTDSIKKSLIEKLNLAGAEEAKRSAVKFKESKDAIQQERLLEEIKAITLKSKAFMKQVLDTAVLNAEVKKIKNWYQIAGDGIFTNKGTSNTFRNLSTTSKLLSELLKRVNHTKKQIDQQEESLVNFRFKIDSLSSDSILYTFSSDTVATKEYLNKMRVIVYEIAPVDTALKQTITNIRKMQYKVDVLQNQLTMRLEEIDVYQKQLSSASLTREFKNINQKVTYARPINEILHFSLLKAELIFAFYVENNLGKIVSLFIFIAIATVFLTSLKKTLADENLIQTDFVGQLVFRYPLFSALVIVPSIFQFIFTDPPFVLSSFLWIVSAVSLAFIFHDFISKYWMNFWLCMVALFILATADNLILQASRTERYLMIVLALAGLICGIWVLLKGAKKELKEKLILYFIFILVAFQFASIIANIFGRFNLSKSLLMGGYVNIVIGILFLWSVRLINEGLTLATRVYTKQERKLFYINFNLVGEKIPSFFYLPLIIGWVILLGRNFYAFKLLTDPFKNFFIVERTLGSYVFTVYDLLIFFVILASAVLISKIVSFFAADKPHSHSANKERKAGLGSWILLIRVLIISLGVLLALAAAGFPMEKITLVIGALGVGIGFGLQTIVNNLVSGLIIAFEKPVNVGDVVEVAGQAGTVKSIGFRSSIISKLDGADVVIPNGDLLNAHLVNWTLAGNRKQISIAFSVAHGTNLAKVKSLLSALLDNNEHILKNQNSAVAFQDFSTNGIEVKLFFWISDFKQGGIIKSDMINDIDAIFKAHKIIIPLPQQVVHLSDEGKKQVSRKSNN